MSATHTDEGLYSRGQYRLGWYRKPDGSLRSPNLYIFYYSAEAGGLKRVSTGTSCHEEAALALDRFFEKRERGVTICPACNRPLEEVVGFPLADALASYLLAKEKLPTFGSIRPRVDHILDYMEASKKTEALCEDVDEDWVQEFRDWLIAQPVVTPSGVQKPRAPATVEGSVRMLAAAINLAERNDNTRKRAQFKPRKTTDVSKPPTFRAGVDLIAKFFDYCTNPRLPEDATPKQVAQFSVDKALRERQPLLRFLQLSVCTWARPDAIYDVSTDKSRKQWEPHARVLDLNPRGRVQTRKHRPQVPVPKRMADLLDRCDGYYVGQKSIRRAMRSMLDHFNLPQGEGETGTYLIRRSMATIVRRPQYLGETNWVQGEMMLGHKRTSISDIYAIPDPANMGLVLDAIDRILDEIVRVAPNAFDAETSGF